MREENQSPLMKIAVALVHIFFATLWLGGAFFYTVLLLPKLSAAWTRASSVPSCGRSE